MRILVVEDDTDLSGQIVRLLSHEGYAVDQAADGPTALAMGQDHPYAAIVLDPGLPGMDGFTVLKRWRAAGLTMPVIVLTASRTEVADMREGVQAGATNYLLKPADPDLLLDWVRGVVNSNGPNHATPVLIRGKLKVDTAALRVWYDGEPIRLSPTEFRILHLLLTNGDKPVSAEAIVDRAFDADSIKSSHEIPVYISRLRQKVDRRLIETVHGFGYRLIDPDNPG